MEKHYSIRQLEMMTGLDYSTLRRRIQDEKGVLNLKLRKNNCFRIPVSVWNRIYEKWQNKGGAA